MTRTLRCFLVLSMAVCSQHAFALSDPLPAGFQVFPADNIWNTPVDTAPLHPNSALWMADANSNPAGVPLHPNFLSGLYLGHYTGFPYSVVGNATPKVLVAFAAGAHIAESDPLPAVGLPIPPDFALEGDPIPVDPASDHHLILVDVDKKVLHELYAVTRQANGSLTCLQYSRWDLTSNALRPDGWTSADAAGLPIFPLLVRWDELQTGTINHALRFVLPATWRPHLWPARHDAPTGGTNNPPMGMRVRLKASFDISGYSATNQVILKALKKYGMFMADNGGGWGINGAPNPNFNDIDLQLLRQITPSAAFEVVDTSSWMIDPNSGQAGGTPPPPGPLPLPAPSFNPPSMLPVNGQLSASYPTGYSISAYHWSIVPSTPPTSSPSAGVAGLSQAPASLFATPNGTALLAPLNLPLGYYQISVTATDAYGNVSPAASAYVSLVNSDLSAVRVYPNPWRSDRHASLPITFDHLTANSRVKIFTLSAHHVKTLPVSSSIITWDRTNESGERVASGLYFYLITDDQGQKTRGQLAIIK